MQLLVDQSSTIARYLGRSTQLILLGLVVLGMRLLWPPTPIIAAVALICLGATMATVERLRHSATRASLLLIHVSVYGSLYLVFVGASLDLAARSGHGVDPWVIVDLAVSLCPLAAAAQLAIGMLRDADPV